MFITLVINEKQHVDINTFNMEINIINIIVSCFDKRIFFLYHIRSFWPMIVDV